MPDVWINSQPRILRSLSASAPKPSCIEGVGDNFSSGTLTFSSVKMTLLKSRTISVLGVPAIFVPQWKVVRLKIVSLHQFIRNYIFMLIKLNYPHPICYIHEIKYCLMWKKSFWSSFIWHRCWTMLYANGYMCVLRSLRTRLIPCISVEEGTSQITYGKRKAIEPNSCHDLWWLVMICAY